ncbi:MAG: KGG domain-containing protein [Thermoplasmatota archaeon]
MHAPKDLRSSLDRSRTIPVEDAVDELQEPMTLSEAGRRGGQTTKARYGPEFYSKIGAKGGETVARERGSDYYAEIGRKGGRARVEQSRRTEKPSEATQNP